MKYNCELVIKDRMLWSDSFKIYIKYKSLTSKGLYKKIVLVDYYDDGYCETLETQLQGFNSLSMEDIKQMIKDDILQNQYAKSEKDKDKLKQLIKISKTKQSKFTIEI